MLVRVGKVEDFHVKGQQFDRTRKKERYSHEEEIWS